MHARLSFIEGSPEAIDAGVVSFRDQVVPSVRENSGTGALLLLDRESGKAIAVTLWPSEDAMRASEERANALRAQAAEAIHATEAPKVERYEVAVAEYF